MQYFQETLRNTQEEFRREFSAIKSTIDLSRNNRSDSVPPVTRSTSSQNNSFSNAPSAYISVKLKDWKVSYNGEGSVSDFLFKLDTLSQRSQCPQDYVLANFHLFLSNKAETWYWDYIKQNPNDNYISLKEALLKEFDTLETDQEILLKISTRRQYSKETYDDFHSSITRLNLRLRNPMSFISLIEIIKKNVNPEIKVLLFISDPKDLGELRLLARKASS